MKMQNKIYETLTTAGKSSYAIMKELGDINTSLLRQMTELQYSFAVTTIGSGVKQAKVLSGTTNYRDILNAQVDFANEYVNKVTDFNRQTAGVMIEARDDMVALFEKGLENVTEKSNRPKAQRAAKKAAN